ncbi:hypothetical protein GYH30_000997 [Glycine max]|nr:hypothetical protein GYH30_000997 [Glycine max]
MLEVNKFERKMKWCKHEIRGCYLLILLRLNKLWDVLCHLFLLENCDIED